MALASYAWAGADWEPDWGVVRCAFTVFHVDLTWLPLSFALAVAVSSYSCCRPSSATDSPLSRAGRSRAEALPQGLEARLRPLRFHLARRRWQRAYKKVRRELLLREISQLLAARSGPGWAGHPPWGAL